MINLLATYLVVVGVVSEQRNGFYRMSLTVWKFHDFSITQNLREINFTWRRWTGAWTSTWGRPSPRAQPSKTL